MLEHYRGSNRLAIAARKSEQAYVPGAGREYERPAPGILIVLWRRRRIVFGSVAAALVVSVVYLLHATPMYRSTSVLYVQGGPPRAIGDDLSADENPTSNLATQCQVIQSSAVLSNAVDLQDMQDAQTLRDVENPVYVLKDQLTAVPAKQGDLITVSMDSTNPKDAAIIVNAVVEAYIEYQSKQHQSTAVEVLRILQNELNRHEADLKVAQTAMINFKQQYPDLVLQTANGNPALNRFSEYSEALIQAQLHLLDLRTAAAEANASRTDPDALKRIVDRFQLSTTLANETDPALLAEYRTAKLHLDDLTTELGPSHQSVQEAARHLGGVQNQIQQAAFDAGNSYMAIIQGSVSAAEQRVHELEAAVEGERRTATKMNLKQEQYDQLQQNADRIEKSMDLLDSRMGEIDVTADVGALTVSVLETAVPAGSPVRPKAAIVAGIGLVAGLMVGIAAALLRDLMDQRLRTTEEISTLLGLPVLGAVPYNLSAKTSRREQAQEIHLRPRSQAAEAYRTVRTAIHFGAADERPSKTILVTSPQPGDGKSTMASNLAIGIAQAGRRVLLIDADCRRPMQQELFHVDASVGLSNILMGDANAQNVVQKTNVDRLDILVCGPLPENPAELLNGQKFLDVLKEASQVYDQIVIDSPPVMAVTDARIIAASCDVTILVLRAGTSTRKMAERALEALESVGAAVLGVVVNAVPRGNDGYGYYYHRYGYGTGEGGHSGNGNGNGNGNGHANGSVVVAHGTLED